MSDVAISVSDVSKRYRLYRERNDSLKASLMRGRRARYEEFWALRDVSFDVPAGTVFGLIGENGSGKSTLLKCMARILRPEQGSIATVGKISALLELGAGFHPELSGRENVFLNGSILGMSKRELTERFDGIVEFAGLEQFIDSPVKNYSSGMYTRLGFSVAINVDPDILLVDEVLAVGDAEFQRRCFTKLAELRSSGKTIVMVTHALGTVRELCDQVALLEDGELRAVGPANVVVEQYLAGVFAVDDGDRVTTQHDRPRLGVFRTELLDDRGQRPEHLRTGDPVTVRLHYEVPALPPKPAFGLIVHSLEGVELARTSTADRDVDTGSLPPSGHVDVRVDRLALLPGEYEITTAMGDDAGVIGVPAKDRITIEPGETREEHGLISLGACWDASTSGDRS